MTRDGWEDIEDREVLESFFHEKVRRHLVSQEFDESDLEALEHEKILGTLTYFVSKLLEWKDGRAEGYLERYLQHFLTTNASSQTIEALWTPDYSMPLLSNLSYLRERGSKTYPKNINDAR